MSSSASDHTNTSGRSPAFQFYPNDFLSDANVVVMSLQERGAYITLLCVCWQQGSLPPDLTHLARLCGVPLTVFRKLWPAVECCFRESNGRYIHPRLEREREKQEDFRRRQSDNGKLGGRPKKPTNNPTETQTKAVGLSGLSQTKAKKSSSIFDLQSSDFSQTQERVRVFPPRDKSPSEVSDEIAERAGRFCADTYPRLYAECRKGARYISKPALDFQEALQLVATWDDTRLEQIARVFLTTDHEFAEKGSRTMAQFRAMASWCDSRLVEAGIA